ncbi:MAG: UvrD-helicase domain-containing protein [Muribaculaceae bacterium]|nr:UvrD-helicase domain-containing protein [Muribaculaceae bacterium]
MSAEADTSYLDQLNEAQRAAVEYTGGPELVIAGAGSGKTRVLTYKIVHLLRSGHYPRHILALTFTNKAAREMRERICGLVGTEVASKLWMGTFHSIFSRFLRMHAERLGFKSNFTIYDASDSKTLIKRIIRELKLDDKLYRPGVVAADISNAKNNLFSPEDYAADADITRSNADCKRSAMPEIYRLYRDRCRIAGAMDFDDLLYYTNVLLRDNPDVLEQFRSYFSYILVDEYQDTNFAQHLIVRQLAGERQKLCVVGDDAQSIYSFRGANIRNILDLKKSFPALRTFKLEENYRSTRNIIGAANTLIAANKEQIPKEVFSNKDEGERIEVVQAYNDYEEAYIVANRLAQVRMRTHAPLSDFAVLYRTNAQSRVIEEALRNRNVAYRIYGGLSFYQRKEIKDAICYFRLAVNPDDDEAFCRVINTPKRGIGDTTVKKVAAAAVGAGVSMYEVLSDPARHGLEVNKGTASKLQAFASMIAGFVKRHTDGDDADRLAANIYTATGIMQEYVSDSTPENVSKLENLQELLKGVGEFADAERESGGDASMANYLAQIQLLTDQDEEKADTDCVTLMTIHAAKGLEFTGVFVVGVEENLLPSAMSMHSASEIEEERRLMYVAITRAKRFCMVSYARQRTVNGKTEQAFPSRFLRDIDSRYLRLMTGSSIDGPRSYGNRRPGASARVSTFDSAPVRSPEASRPSAPAPELRPATSTAPKPRAKAPATAEGHCTHSAAELAEGQRIEHPTFGLGVIREVDTSRVDDRVVVEFSADGIRRTLLLKFARFTILS